MRLLIPGQMRPRRFRRRLAGARAAFANTTDMLEHLRCRLKELGLLGFVEMVLFIGFVLAGFFYVIKKGALKWE